MDDSRSLRRLEVWRLNVTRNITYFSDGGEKIVQILSQLRVMRLAILFSATVQHTCWISGSPSDREVVGSNHDL
jgi:hypothetical protein